MSQGIENYFNQMIGQVVKIEIEDNQPGMAMHYLLHCKLIHEKIVFVVIDEATFSCMTNSNGMHTALKHIASFCYFK